ncbi:MAG: VOC family protein [Promethearchaeota archaeon]
MTRILGIGGVFFKSEDPKKLKDWYVKNLGFESDQEGYIIFWQWEREMLKRRGYTLWGPFPRDTKYFKPSEKPFMINFMVDDLDAILAKLKEKDVEVDNHIEEHEEGRFCWFMDPEGNRVELWEPPLVQED